MHLVPQIAGMSSIVSRYDGMILDLWGVIHDGEQAYPGVAECLDRLTAAGKRLCLLSNAPRRTDGVIAKLDGMGIGRDRYRHVMTSGEAAYEALRARDDSWHAALGSRLYHIGPDRDVDVYDGLPYTVAATPDEADFVLNTGIVDFAETAQDYDPALEACAERRLPMVCANPDLVVMVGPRLVVCAGTLAARYESLGGNVFYHGKPHAPVYARCLALMGVAGKRRILAVGDSLRTDIAGANAAGIDSALVTGGIHCEELGGAWGSPADPDRLAAAIEASGHLPTWALPRFVW